MFWVIRPRYARVIHPDHGRSAVQAHRERAEHEPGAGDAGGPGQGLGVGFGFLAAGRGQPFDQRDGEPVSGQQPGRVQARSARPRL